jgi:hypothetical protein
MLIGWCLPALAGEVSTWTGGFVSTGVDVVAAPGATSAQTILSQVEADFRVLSGDWYARVDLDYHFDPISLSGSNEGYQLAPHYPLPPEYALVQYGWKYHLRAGVTNPDFGLQEWDEKANYLPTYSGGWSFANGQNLGLEPGITFDDGTDLFVWGGYDLAWLTPSFGLGVQTEQDLFGVWSGAFYMPALEFGMLISAQELYAADWLWLSSEIDVGTAGGGILAGGMLIANVLPDGSYGGALRFEQFHVDDEVVTALETTVPQTTLSAALRADPLDWLHLSVEGKESFPGASADPYFTGTLLVAVSSPGEPYDDFATEDPPEE